MNKEKSGICLLYGKTNVGKSSLINKLVKNKVTIVSDKPDTTRTRILAVYNDNIGQIAYIDSPGINYRKDLLSEKLNKISFNSINGNDLIYYLVDRPYSKKDERLLEELQKEEVPIFLIVNKIDTFSKRSQIDKIILSFKDKLLFKEFIPISTKTGKNLDVLIKKTYDYLPETGLLFPKDFKVSLSKNEMIEEIVREKMFYHTESEIPYSSAIFIDHIKKENEQEIYFISICVEKETQKKIILGSKGEIIKKIRLQSQSDIKAIISRNIKLELFVKVKKDWRKSQKEINKLKLGE